MELTIVFGRSNQPAGIDAKPQNYRAGVFGNYCRYNRLGKNLETAPMTVKTKGNASRYITGIGKATSFGVVKGKTSTCVLAAQPVLYFVYRVESNSISPKDVITNRHQFYSNASDWFVRHKPQHSSDQCLHWLER